MRRLLLSLSVVGAVLVVASASAATAPRGSVTIAAVGDTELGNTPQLPADPLSYLAPVKSALAAPIVFGNLEGTMTNATTSKCATNGDECYAFRVPPSYARLYRSFGFRVVNAANNHSDDFGSAGVASTTAALRAAGIAQAGLPGEIAVVRDGATRVAFVDFAPYSTTNNLLQYPAAAALITRAHHLAPVVVVYMHAGAEGASADHVTRKEEYYDGEDRGNPYKFAHFAVDHGAALVIASGPHVLRGLEFYRGHLIDYSLGDFVNFHNFAADGDLRWSAILHVTLTASGAFVSAHFTSLDLSTIGQAFVDAQRHAAAFVNQLSRADFGASAAIVSANGTVVPAT